MLFVEVFQVYQADPIKADFFRRLAHCATLLAKGGVVDGDDRMHLIRYLAGDSITKPSNMERLLRQSGVNDFGNLERAYGNASRHLALETLLKNERIDPLDAPYPTGPTFLTVIEEANYFGFLRPKLAFNRKNPMIGTEHFVTSLDANGFTGRRVMESSLQRHRIAEKYGVGEHALNEIFQVMEYPYEDTWSEYVRFLKNHSRQFPVFLSNGEEFEIELTEVLRFPVPVFA